MRRTLPSIITCLLFAACGGDDDGPAGDPPDAEAPAIDAQVCAAPVGYPEQLRPVTVELGAPHSLTLDGNGERCDQLIRALVDPTGRPPELAELDADSVEGSCEFDDVTSRDIVRLSFPEYGGSPLFGTVQDVLAHVDEFDDVVYLAGNYIPAGHSPPPACLDADAVAAGVPGESLGYTTFAACTPTGEGSYEIVADDEILVGDEGVYLAYGGDELRRVRLVEVYLLEDHVTAETINSNLYCCDGASNAHCVGERIYVDVHTGEVVGDEGNCITC